MSKEEMKLSLEAKWRQGQIKLYLFLSLVTIMIDIIVSLFAVLIYGNVDFSFIIPVIIIIGIIFALPFAMAAIFQQAKYNKIISLHDKVSIHETVLNNPHTSYSYRGAVYFTVTIDIEGIQKSFNTKPVFSSKIFGAISLEQYNNKKIKVAYIKDSDDIILIG